MDDEGNEESKGRKTKERKLRSAKSSKKDVVQHHIKKKERKKKGILSENAISPPPSPEVFSQRQTQTNLGSDEVVRKNIQPSVSIENYHHHQKGSSPMAPVSRSNTNLEDVDVEVLRFNSPDPSAGYVMTTGTTHPGTRSLSPSSNSPSQTSPFIPPSPCNFLPSSPLPPNTFSSLPSPSFHHSPQPLFSSSSSSSYTSIFTPQGMVGRSSSPSPPPSPPPPPAAGGGVTAKPLVLHQHVLAEGFLDFYQSEQFSDVTLICKKAGKSYRAHRLILASSSQYFHNLFIENNEVSEIHLEVADPNNVFPDVIKYIYSGDVVINSENSIPLLALADKLDLSDLKTQSSRYLAGSIRHENCISMLKRAFEFDAKEVIDKCTNVIARNFCFLHVDFSFLPPHIYLKILQHEDLAVKSEVDLLTDLQSYVHSRKNISEEPISKEILDEMVRCIRFVQFSMDQLRAHVIGNSMIPPDVIIESLAAKVTTLEQNTSSSSSSSPPLPTNPHLFKKRKQPGLTLGYSEKKGGVGPNGNGVLNWIATNCGITEWQNSSLQAIVKVTASSIDKGNPLQFLSPEPSELWTADVPASWICIDLGESHLVAPTHYTLQHGGHYKGDSLRHWDLQGSIDGKKWFLIRRHNNDCSLNSPFALHSWSIELSKREEAEDEQNFRFRFFRILQTGHNSSNHNFLMLSGFEIYGDLFEK